MKKVYVARDSVDASLVRGFLESRDIDAVVTGEHLGAVRSELPFREDTSPAVWVVRDADAERARVLLALRRSGEGAAGLDPWTCGGCGELIEAQFLECWRCCA